MAALCDRKKVRTGAAREAAAPVGESTVARGPVRNGAAAEAEEAAATAVDWYVSSAFEAVVVEVAFPAAALASKRRRTLEGGSVVDRVASAGRAGGFGAVMSNVSSSPPPPAAGGFPTSDKCAAGRDGALSNMSILLLVVVLVPK